MQVIDLDAIARLQRRYLLVPSLMATLGSGIFQTFFFMLPALGLALLLAGGVGIGLQDLVGIAAFLLAWVQLFALGGMLLHSAFARADRWRLWLALLMLTAGTAVGLMIFASSPGWIIGLLVALILLGAALALGFDAMIARLEADAPGRMLLRGLQRRRGNPLRRVSARGFPFLRESALLTIRLLLVTLILAVVTAVHAGISIAASGFGVISAFVALFVFRPLVSTMAVKAMRRFRARLARSAAELYEADPRPPILFLRSFKDDALTIPFTLRPWMRAWGVRRRELALEEALAEEAFRFGPVGAVQDPSARLRPLGAARHLVTEGDWQDYVAAQVQRAAAIVVIHSRTPGVRWELDHIRQRAMWFKRITVFPPQHPVPAEGLSLSDLGEGGLIRLGDRHPLCHVCPQAGRSFLVVGRQRDTEAYGRALLIALSLVIEGDGWAALTGARPADQA